MEQFGERGRYANFLFLIERARLKKEHAVAQILAQSCRQGAPCRARTYNDEVMHDLALPTRPLPRLLI